MRIRLSKVEHFPLSEKEVEAQIEKAKEQVKWDDRLRVSVFVKHGSMAEAHYCMDCGIEYFAEWPLDAIEINDEIDKYNKKYKPIILDSRVTTEQRKISQMKACPNCGGTLISANKNTLKELFPTEKDRPQKFNEEPRFLFNYFDRFREWKTGTFDGIDGERQNIFNKGRYSANNCFVKLKELAAFRENRLINSEFSSKLKQWDKPISEKRLDNVTAFQSADSLKEYLYQLIQLETTIYALSERIPQLYLKQREATRIVASEVYEIKAGYQSEIDSHRQELDELQKKFDDNIWKIKKRIQAERDNISEYQYKKGRVRSTVDPVKLDLPAEPVPPELKKPGFFNKKKILAENEALMAAYEEAKRKYSLDVEEIKRKEASMTEAKYAELERSFANKIKSAESILAKAEDDLAQAQNTRPEHEQKLEAIKEKIQELEQKVKDVDTPSKSDSNAPSIFWHNSLRNEIQEAETLLEKTFEARNTLYSYNIVFGKYRNLVALSTFYEYLMAGRCSSLEGTDGAYNIYEGEIRANMIISQLSTVIEKLDDIKQGQYMLYTKLSEATSELSSLNDKMDSAVKSLTHIENSTASIENSAKQIASNAEQIAYNTEASAYYAKKNAELTNALGFMVALK